LELYIEHDGSLHLCNVRKGLPIGIASSQKNRIIIPTTVKTSKLATKLVSSETIHVHGKKGIRNYAYQQIHILMLELLRTVCGNYNRK